VSLLHERHLHRLYCIRRQRELRLQEVAARLRREGNRRLLAGILCFLVIAFSGACVVGKLEEAANVKVPRSPLLTSRIREKHFDDEPRKFFVEITHPYWGVIRVRRCMNDITLECATPGFTYSVEK